MNINFNSFNAARTHELLKKFPSWINKHSGSKLFHLTNTIGMESQAAKTIIEEVAKNQNPYTMDIDIPTNIKRIDGIPPLEARYFGKKNGMQFPLFEVVSEIGLFTSVPTRVAASAGYQLDSVSPVIDLKYISNSKSGDAVYAAITDQFPGDDSAGLLQFELDGSFISNTPLGRMTQSYDALGIDEEIVFMDKQATIVNIPINGSFKLYDILNLIEDKPTEIDASWYTLSGKTITWTDASEPEGRYIGEYDYFMYSGISAIATYLREWDINRVSGEEIEGSLDYLTLDDVSYSPDLNVSLDPAADHTLISDNTTKKVQALQLYNKTASDHFIKISPYSARAGRTVSVTMVATKVFPEYGTTENWVLNEAGDNDYVKVISNEDPAFLDSSVLSVQVFNSDDVEVTDNFGLQLNMETWTVTINANPDFAGQTLHINIYYRAEVSADITAVNHTEFFEYEGQSVYYSEIDVTSLVNQSLALPTINEFTITAPLNYIAKTNLQQAISLQDSAFVPEVYLNRTNQELHFKDMSGSSQYSILLGMTKDENGIFKTDIYKHIDDDDVEIGTWEYRDIAPYREFLLILRTSVVNDDDDFIKHAEPGRGASYIDFYNILTGKVEYSFQIQTANAAAITIIPGNKIAVAAYKQAADDSYETWVQEYQFYFDYYFKVKSQKGYTVFVRSDIDKFITDNDYTESSPFKLNSEV